jgi:hypothetical protein
MTEPWTPGPWKLDADVDWPTVVVPFGNANEHYILEIDRPEDARLIVEAPAMADFIEEVAASASRHADDAHALLSRIRGR